jgi:hypothetical protein
MGDQHPTYSIIYGVAEGPAISQHLRHVLRAMGLHQADTLEQADVIIVHSGGIIDLPCNVQDKTIIIIAPSLSRKYSSMIMTELEKISRDLITNISSHKLLNWVEKTLCNTCYLCSRQKRLYRLWTTHRKRNQNLPRIEALNILVICYKDDPWSAYVPVSETVVNPLYQFISLDATHDDIWLYPERYAMYFGIHEVSMAAYIKETSA